MTTAWPLVAFAIVLVLFHTSEYLLAAIYMRDELSVRSWLLSRPYCIAILAGLAEYFLEACWWPHQKQQVTLSCVGLALVITGELLRKVAMFTARSNFTHDIRKTKVEGHVLVTWGVYRYCRHPGYLGWFVWAVGTQVLLVNPLSIVVFSFLVWRFFKERIQYEEYFLRRFFGREHEDYVRSTPTLIPFIR